MISNLSYRQAQDETVQARRKRRHLARSSRRRKGDGKVFEPAQRVVVAALDRSCDFDGRDFSRQCRQHDLAFEARDQLAAAHMDPGAVTDMTAGPPGHVVTVGIIPTPGVAVGRAEEHQDLFALANTKPRDIDVACRCSEESLYRAL